MTNCTMYTMPTPYDILVLAAELIDQDRQSFACIAIEGASNHYRRAYGLSEWDTIYVHSKAKLQELTAIRTQAKYYLEYMNPASDNPAFSVWFRAHDIDATIPESYHSSNHLVSDEIRAALKQWRVQALLLAAELSLTEPYPL